MPYHYIMVYSGAPISIGPIDSVDSGGEKGRWTKFKILAAYHWLCKGLRANGFGLALAGQKLVAIMLFSTVFVPGRIIAISGRTLMLLILQIS